MDNPQPYFLVFAGAVDRLRNTLDVAVVGGQVLPGFRARRSRVGPTT
jgi:hypothetical protein